jgi:Fur family peroxide stress response transcriptional regulator
MKTLTKHRSLIWENLKSRKDHPSAKMVYDSAKEISGNISFATVYNSLEYLVEHGLIKKLSFGEDRARYDATTFPHAHLICEVCGSIQDIPEPFLSLDSLESQYKFQVSETHIDLYGVCHEHNQ